MEALTDDRILSLLNPISYSVVSRKRARVRTLMRKFSLVNNEMKITPALALSDIARSHRLGKMREGAGNRRAIIVRFNSDRVRDCVYRGRVNLKGYNSQHRDNPVFINDDLTMT